MNKLNEKTLVSIVLVTRNNSQYIDDAVSSVLSQSYKKWELIIIDDASTDNLEEKILKYKNNPKIKYYKNKNHLGVVGSLNKAISISKGSLIARIDGDDIWFSKNKLLTQVNILANDKKTVLVGTNARVIDEQGNFIKNLEYPTSSKAIKKYLLIENCFIHSSVVYRKDVLKKTGLYSKDYEFAQDYELWLRMGRKNKLININELMVSYRINKSGISRTNYSGQLSGTLKAVKKNKIYYSNYYIAIFLWYLRAYIPRPVREKLSESFRSIFFTKV